LLTVKGIVISTVYTNFGCPAFFQRPSKLFLITLILSSSIFIDNLSSSLSISSSVISLKSFSYSSIDCIMPDKRTSPANLFLKSSFIQRSVPDVIKFFI
jgi:hypothetical protein